MNRRAVFEKKPINLALQGGGSHGAFTWGVLDCLLEDDRVDIEAISGTSAGAINAVVVADGLMQAGNDGARQALERFWRSVSRSAMTSPLRRTPIDALFGNWSLDHSPAFMFFDLVSRISSPYELNPLNINPLRDLLAEQIDFERVRECDKLRLFISATNVETGRVKVFRRDELTPEAVMASACLPFIFQSVVIDGVPYWDGGYMGNPVLFPFFRQCRSGDIVVVQINPIVREGTPVTARQILNRMNEITFNSSLLREFRAIDFVSRLLEDGRLEKKDYKHVLMHRIAADDALKDLGASSKLNAEWEFFTHLFKIGRSAAEEWLTRHFRDIGKRSTLDLRPLFQDGDSTTRGAEDDGMEARVSRSI